MSWAIAATSGGIEKCWTQTETVDILWNVDKRPPLLTETFDGIMKTLLQMQREQQETLGLVRELMKGVRTLKQCQPSRLGLPESDLRESLMELLYSSGYCTGIGGSTTGTCRSKSNTITVHPGIQSTYQEHLLRLLRITRSSSSHHHRIITHHH